MKRIDYSNITEKLCTNCKLCKPLASFRTRKLKHSLGYFSHCRDCDKLRKRILRSTKEYKEKELAANRLRDQSPEYIAKRKEKKLMSRYAITTEQQNQMLLNQKGKCAICPDYLIEIHTDHNHSTGKVRGLLCPKCNHAIGFLRDNVEIAIKAASYIAMDGV